MIAVTGANGQLGQAVVDKCKRHGLSFRAFGRTELDVTDPKAVSEVLVGETFDCTIHCAAYTAVDAAEDRPQEAFAANAYAPWLLASTGVPILAVSTDYVFDGKAASPYEADATARPVSVYGLSKRAGEVALLEGGFSGAIVRTAWVYSKREGTKNFFHTMQRLARERDEIRVVNDQIGAPTLAEDLAAALVTLYEKGAHHKPMHVLHCTNSGTCSWFDFATEIIRMTNPNCTVTPIPTSAYPTKAKRPAYSVLSLRSLDAYGIKPRHWKEALLSPL